MISGWIKRFLAALAAMTLAVSLAACDKGGESSDSSDDSSYSEEDNKPKRVVGYIFHDEVDDANFSSEMNVQRLLAANRSGIETCYVDNVSITDLEKAIKALAAAGCTDIVAGSPVYASMLGAITNKYMNLNFISFGATGGGTNVCAYTEQPYQGAYAAGVAAAFNSSKHRIGFVGDTDMLCMNAVLNAVTLGARQLVIDTTKVYAISAYRDDEIERAVDELISGWSCDVIVCYTSSEHAEEYCQRKGIKFVGCHDFSGRESDYSNMLLYFYSRRDSFFLAQFKQMQLDTWQPDTYTGNMGNGIISISEALSANKNDGIQRVLDTLIPFLSTGGEVFGGQIIDNKGVVQQIQTDSMSDLQIYKMDWFVQGVEIVGNYREPLLNLPPNDMTIEK